MSKNHSDQRERTKKRKEGSWNNETSKQEAANELKEEHAGRSVGWGYIGGSRKDYESVVITRLVFLRLYPVARDTENRPLPTNVSTRSLRLLHVTYERLHTTYGFPSFSLFSVTVAPGVSTTSRLEFSPTTHPLSLPSVAASLFLTIRENRGSVVIVRVWVHTRTYVQEHAWRRSCLAFSLNGPRLLSPVYHAAAHARLLPPTYPSTPSTVSPMSRTSLLLRSMHNLVGLKHKPPRTPRSSEHSRGPAPPGFLQSLGPFVVVKISANTRITAFSPLISIFCRLLSLCRSRVFHFVLHVDRCDKFLVVIVSGAIFSI